MIYNGKELLIPGCDDYLCDIAILQEATSWTSEHYDCSVRYGASLHPLRSQRNTQQTTFVQKDYGAQVVSLIVIVLCSLSIGIFIGAFVVNYYIKSKAVKKDLSNYSKLDQANESL